MLRLILALCACGGMYAEARSPKELLLRITRVLDGDTVEGRTAGAQTYRVRMAGIDAPEKGQHFGQLSKEKLTHLLLGKNVKVLWRKADRSGRIVGKIAAGTSDTSLEMVRLGMAWHYRIYGKDQGDSDWQQYHAKELEARAARRGLWADARAIPPWEFRHNRQRRPPTSTR